MPVTTHPAAHDANVSCRRKECDSSPESLLKATSLQDHEKMDRMLQSSFDTEQKTLYASTNGFVHGAVEAYSSHHHLILRPDDVWLAILTQLSFYINAHSEELRGRLVPHDGKKELIVEACGIFESYDWTIFTQKMSDLLAQNVVDPQLRDWIMQTFSTTTPADQVVSAIVMMGALQNYFDFTARFMCGLPSVTLLGERSDWQSLLLALDKIPSFGMEATEFYNLLVPVCRHFVATFDDPASASVKSFWNRIVHYQRRGSGTTRYSGWITAFCFWDKRGASLYERGIDRSQPPSTQEGAMPQIRHRFGSARINCVLDGVTYHGVDSADVPPGYSSVPVKIDYYGLIYTARMVAGSVGIRMERSGMSGPGGRQGPASETEMVEGGLDTLRPVSGWWMFLVDEGRETEGEKRMKLVREMEEARASGGNREKRRVLRNG
ncbi:MAG: hypothetical protein FRX48_08123 [Lasallia pustulata]|uniref:DUF4419 domain-containing protein n=1 Tax=Lasallia pustulata TaxID=136370 RepID=A0A5M8PGC0_9LECA|nr:MAG: hypothetical protein FRX48_08123 [Lasallia pustulata]